MLPSQSRSVRTLSAEGTLRRRSEGGARERSHTLRFRAAWASQSPGITTGVGGASLDWDRRRRVTPVQTTSQEAWPEAEPLGWNNSLRREPWWNAVKDRKST